MEGRRRQLRGSKNGHVTGRKRATVTGTERECHVKLIERCSTDVAAGPEYA